MDKVALILAAAIFIGVLVAMESRPSGPTPQPVTPGPDVSLSVSADVIPVAMVIEKGEIQIKTHVQLPTPVGTFGVHISPKRVKGLYVRLGSETRMFPVDGKIKLLIPNSLNGNSTFEWDEDYAIITIPNPSNLRFPEPER